MQKRNFITSNPPNFFKEGGIAPLPPPPPTPPPKLSSAIYAKHSVGAKVFGPPIVVAHTP